MIQPFSPTIGLLVHLVLLLPVQKHYTFTATTSVDGGRVGRSVPAQVIRQSWRTLG